MGNRASLGTAEQMDVEAVHKRYALLNMRLPKRNCSGDDGLTLRMAPFPETGDASFSTPESNLECARKSAHYLRGPFESQGCFSCAVMPIAAVGPMRPPAPTGFQYFWDLRRQTILQAHHFRRLCRNDCPPQIIYVVGMENQKPRGPVECL